MASLHCLGAAAQSCAACDEQQQSMKDEVVLISTLHLFVCSFKAFFRCSFIRLLAFASFQICNRDSEAIEAIEAEIKSRPQSPLVLVAVVMSSGRGSNTTLFIMLA